MPARPSFNVDYERREIERDLDLKPHPEALTGPCVLAPPAPGMALASTGEMDPKLWGNLQHHMSLGKIFMHIPFREFFQLRLVCKDFNAMAVATDENFLKGNACPLSNKPIFCLVHPDGIWQVLLEYDAVSSEWHQLPVPLPYGTEYPPKWIAGNFLLFNKFRWPCTRREHRYVSVFNLCTRMLHVLPPLYTVDSSFSFDWTLEGLPVNEHDSTFRVFIAALNPDAEKMHTSIYDSVTRAWDTKVQTFPGPCVGREKLRSPPPHGSVLYNGSLYISMYDVPFIMSYDLVSGLWSRLESPCNQPASIHFGCSGGRLYAVTHIQAEKATDVHEVHVHQLIEGENRRWGEVGSMPMDLHDELFATKDLSPEADEVEIELELAMEASFCDQYVLICVYLQDYYVVEHMKFRIWCDGFLMPRRFALYNLATDEWKITDFLVSKDRKRIEIGKDY